MCLRGTLQCVVQTESLVRAELHVEVEYFTNARRLGLNATEQALFHHTYFTLQLLHAKNLQLSARK